MSPKKIFLTKIPPPLFFNPFKPKNVDFGFFEDFTNFKGLGVKMVVGKIFTLIILNGKLMNLSLSLDFLSQGAKIESEGTEIDK